MTDAYRGITTFALPFFSLHPSGIRDSNGIVGGFVYSQEAFNKKVDRNHFRGAGRSSAAGYSVLFSAGIPTFNYESLVGNGFSLADTPKGAVVYNRPPFFSSSTSTSFSGRSFFVVALLLFQSKRNRMLQKLSKAQLRRSRSVKTIRTCSTTCRSYTCRSVVLDESGDPVDTVFCDVNRSSNGRSIPKERIIGKKGRRNFCRRCRIPAFYPDRDPPNGRSIYLPILKSIDTFYEVELCCSLCREL